MYTQGKWIYNETRNAIESDSEWLVKPNIDDEEEGVPIQVISTFAAMGGDDTKADIDLICAAPVMLDFLYKLLSKYDISNGGILSEITIEEINEIKEIVKLADKQ